MIVVSSCSCLWPIHWSQALSWEWRCSWSSADRRCSNYIGVINNFIANSRASFIRGLTVCYVDTPVRLKASPVTTRMIHLCSYFNGNVADVEWYVFLLEIKLLPLPLPRPPPWPLRRPPPPRPPPQPPPPRPRHHPHLTPTTLIEMTRFDLFYNLINNLTHKKQSSWATECDKLHKSCNLSGVAISTNHNKIWQWLCHRWSNSSSTRVSEWVKMWVKIYMNGGVSRWVSLSEWVSEWKCQWVSENVSEYVKPSSLFENNFPVHRQICVDWTSSSPSEWRFIHTYHICYHNVYWKGLRVHVLTESC